MSKVKNLNLAKEGQLRVGWAASQMPVLQIIKEEFIKEKPFKNIVIGACLHVTKETAVLIETLQAGGAKIFLAGSNPLSTQDDVAAYLVKKGIEVFAWREQNDKEYYWCIEKVLDGKPQITIDDGADLVSAIHTKRKNLIKNIFAGQEETTTGVIRLRAMANEGFLKYPIIAVNDTPTKHMFDNVYGTGQSTIDALIRATNILLAGKTLVVFGYGYCGRGVANRGRGMGAKVIICEVDPLKALQATMDGFIVKDADQAAQEGDVFITVTGNKNVIRGEHFLKMKKGAILANAGHFNVEISIPDLEKISRKKIKISNHIKEYQLKNGRKIYLLAEGRLVNLAAAEGHPSSVMDMSFADQALCSRWIVENHQKLKPKVYEVPKEIDQKVAELKLKSLGIEIDKLTKEQKKYLASWQEGT
ncbi:MAG: adenosylhomocysteinase [Microgenomates group bacterium]|nr:adenosylhomocysteinase [Microgenomates group bacterium]